MIHPYNCSDLLVSIVTESDFLDHGLILRKFELAKIICVLFFLEIDYDRFTNAERGDKNLDYSIVVLY